MRGARRVRLLAAGLLAREAITRDAYRAASLPAALRAADRADRDHETLYMRADRAVTAPTPAPGRRSCRAGSGV